ncbi:RDD family protein [Jeotgalibacillus aurantiacus]|uniref:RDD family protein n=1 Tax=Jeotgalibacillus aurantiacus TaxID=2763266 RepID=UPI001D0B5555|nr:RDD family protein [Jeotgalibacillus aurantiacus]
MPVNILTRGKAFLLDYLLILFYLVLIFCLYLVFPMQIEALFSGGPWRNQLAGFLIVTLPVSLYFAVSDSRLVGQTFGKRKTNIQAVDHHGQPLTFLHSFIRVLLKFLPWELSHFLVYRLVLLGDSPMPVSYTILGITIYGLMFTYILTAVFTPKKQTLYDLLTRSRVVRK